MTKPSTDPTKDMSVFDPECVSRTVLEHATGRWGGLVLVALLGEPLRFAELGRRVEGITDRMLSQTLQRFEADGIVARTPHPTVAQRVDYSLTELGRPLAIKLNELIGAIYEVLPGIVAHQREAGA